MERIDNPTKLKIAKVQLEGKFRGWEETDLSTVIEGIRKEDVINVVVEDGGVYLIYWIVEKVAE
jgi:hypothetical protein